MYDDMILNDEIFSSSIGIKKCRPPECLCIDCGFVMVRSVGWLFAIMIFVHCVHSIAFDEEAARGGQNAEAVAGNIEDQKNNHCLVHFLLVTFHVVLNELNVYLIERPEASVYPRQLILHEVDV